MGNAESSRRKKRANMIAIYKKRKGKDRGYR